MATLDQQMDRVERTSEGRLVVVRGRRQVGKSTLVTEWMARRDVPAVFFHALGRPRVADELNGFAHAVRTSTIPQLARMGEGVHFDDWPAALRLVAHSVEQPAVVVIDEFPYLLGGDASIEAVLQAAWDRELQQQPVLLVLIGSDLAMMDALQAYDRPLYGRVDTTMAVAPLTLADTTGLLGLDAVTGFDSHMVTGGFPRVVASRSEHDDLESFLTAACSDDTHPFVVTGQRMLDTEFPPNLAAREVLLAIGSGARSYGAIRTRAGVAQQTLTDALVALQAKEVVAADDPRDVNVLAKRTRYRVADPYLRFWLRFVSRHVDDIARGRGDLVTEAIARSWQDFAGSAVEPLVRGAVEALLPDDRFGQAREVGSFWARDNNPEVDLVGTRRLDGNERVEFVGSIKWRAHAPFATDDTNHLRRDMAGIRGVDERTRTVAVSRTGFADGVHIDVTLTPDDLR